MTAIKVANQYCQLVRPLSIASFMPPQRNKPPRRESRHGFLCLGLGVVRLPLIAPLVIHPLGRQHASAKTPL